MALPEFTSEAEFRSQWIAPFLSKMGFVLPKHVHGQDEQGKDFFFLDHDRFGHSRILSAQAKLGNIGTGKELTELLDQVERSFEVTLKYHKGSHEQHVSSVYVMTNGRISPQARERIWERCRQRDYGENVYFLDGETLDNLERHAVYQHDSEIRQRLVALLNEANDNIQPIQILQQSSGAGTPIFQRCRMLALEEALRSPMDNDLMPYDLLSTVWSLLSELNKNVVPYNISWKPESVETWKRRSSQAFDAMLRVRDAAHDGIRTLDERYSLTIEIMKDDSPN